MADEKVIAALLRVRAEQGRLPLVMAPWQAWALATAAQVASRHPGFKGELAAEAVNVAQQIFAHIVSIEPDLAAILAEGWKLTPTLTPAPAPPGIGFARNDEPGRA